MKKEKFSKKKRKDPYIFGKRDLKDIVFREAFATDANLPKIFHELHPEIENYEDFSYQNINISTIITNTIYNDLAFIVSDPETHQFWLEVIEAQSTWQNSNITRFIQYADRILSNLVVDSKHFAKKSINENEEKGKIPILKKGEQKRKVAELSNLVVDSKHFVKKSINEREKKGEIPILKKGERKRRVAQLSEELANRFLFMTQVNITCLYVGDKKLKDSYSFQNDLARNYNFSTIINSWDTLPIRMITKDNLDKSGLNENSLIREYFRYCEIQDKFYDRSERSVIELVDICIEERIFPEFFEQRRKEVVENMKDVNFILEQMAKENMEAERREKFEKRLNEEIAERIPQIEARLQSKYDTEIAKSVISLLEDPQLPAINTPIKALDALAITGERRKEILEALKERGYTL